MVTGWRPRLDVEVTFGDVGGPVPPHASEGAAASLSLFRLQVNRFLGELWRPSRLR